MEKLRVLSGRETAEILEAEGFALVRQHGSHLVMQKRVGTGTITLPVPDHHELKRGTLLAIIRESGVSRSKFEEE
jgi:predicted RNA binding protein YcfA (HicA-like mRNA interferase family)